MEKPIITPSDWLRILTSPYIGHKEIAISEGCSVKKAVGIVKFLNRNSGSKTCKTDDYLSTYKRTTRKAELALIFQEKPQ